MRSTIVILALSFLALSAWGGNAPVAPKGIVVEPPAPQGLQVQIWVDKPAYAVGETVQIHFRINKDAYIYIWDIEPTGAVRLIFPNYFDQQNFFRAGTYTVPTPGKNYHFRVTPPTGTEYLQIMAVTQPVSGIWGEFSADIPFPLLGNDPEGWRAQIQARVLGLIPEPAERAFDFTCFQIVSGAPPAYGTLQVNTTPPFAELYVDNIFRGYTPKTLVLVAGWHDVLVKKAGYRDWSRRIYLLAGHTRTLNITLSPVANQPPVASFTFTPANPAPGQPVQFDASSSYDPDGTITSYRWDFDNDGTIDATGRVVSHAFSSPGPYNVRLVVTDNMGARSEATKTVNVVVLNRPPVADFTWTPANPKPGDWIQFDASASFDPDGTITDYQWDFDNDGTSDASGRVVFHAFTAPGSYNVRLVVTDNMGASTETTKTVNVVALNQPPVARFTMSPSPAPVGTPVTFDASASTDPDGTITSYSWDLDGDGTVDHYGVVVTQAFYAPGSYRVTLYVTDDRGATAQSTQTLQVVQPGPPGMPNMDGIPGIYVWGTDSWNITVNGSPSWATPHRFRIELRTDGRFVNVSSATGPSPLGLVPEPTAGEWRLVFEGSVTNDRVTYSFQVQGASSIYMDLKLDMDGDGTLESSAGIVRLRQLMVNPPHNPFVVGLPSGYTGPFIPSIDFRIGQALVYTEHAHFIFWETTIEELEGGGI